MELHLLFHVELGLVLQSVLPNQLLAIQNEELLALAYVQLVKVLSFLATATQDICDPLHPGINPRLVDIVVVANLFDIAQVELELTKKQHEVAYYYLRLDRGRVDVREHQLVVDDDQSNTTSHLGDQS